MSIIFPGPYVPPFVPLSNITPFTVRDGYTYLEVLDLMRHYLNDDLVKFVNDNFEKLGDDFTTEVNKLIDAFNEGFAENVDAATASAAAAATSAAEALGYKNASQNSANASAASATASANSANAASASANDAASSAAAAEDAATDAATAGATAGAAAGSSAGATAGSSAGATAGASAGATAGDASGAAAGATAGAAAVSAQKGAVNGITPLDADTLVPDAYLPARLTAANLDTAYKAITVADFAGLPSATANAGKLAVVTEGKVRMIAIGGTWIQASVAEFVTTGDRDTAYAKAAGAYRVSGARAHIIGNPAETATTEYNTSTPAGWYPVNGIERDTVIGSASVPASAAPLASFAKTFAARPYPSKVEYDYSVSGTNNNATVVTLTPVVSAGTITRGTQYPMNIVANSAVGTPWGEKGTIDIPANTAVTLNINGSGVSAPGISGALRTLRYAV